MTTVRPSRRTVTTSLWLALEHRHGLSRCKRRLSDWPRHLPTRLADDGDNALRRERGSLLCRRKPFGAHVAEDPEHDRPQCHKPPLCLAADDLLPPPPPVIGTAPVRAHVGAHTGSRARVGGDANSASARPANAMGATLAFSRSRPEGRLAPASRSMSNPLPARFPGGLKKATAPSTGSTSTRRETLRARSGLGGNLKSFSTAVLRIRLRRGMLAERDDGRAGADFATRSIMKSVSMRVITCPGVGGKALVRYSIVPSGKATRTQISGLVFAVRSTISKDLSWNVVMFGGRVFASGMLTGLPMGTKRPSYNHLVTCGRPSLSASAAPAPRPPALHGAQPASPTALVPGLCSRPARSRRRARCDSRPLAMNAHVTPSRVQQLLESGVEPGKVAELLVATGAWSESGASDIVSTLANNANRLATNVVVGIKAGLDQPRTTRRGRWRVEVPAG